MNNQNIVMGVFSNRPMLEIIEILGNIIFV